MNAINILITNAGNILKFLKEFTVDSAKDVSITYINADGSESIKTFPNIVKQNANLESWKNNFFSVGLDLINVRKIIGNRPDYFRAVIPLVLLDNTNISSFSYTSGRFEFITSSGCCILSSILVDIKSSKIYNTETFDLYSLQLDTGVKKCKFMHNGFLYGGLEIYTGAQSHSLLFDGVTNCSLDYLSYLDVRDGTIINQEINDSLEVLS